MSHIGVTHGVHVILQVTISIIGKLAIAQSSIPKMKSCICGDDEETSEIPPADLVLAHGRLHDGIRASFGIVQVSRGRLLSEQLVELVVIIGKL